MAITPITKAPTRNTKPSFVIDLAGTELQLRGAGRRIRHNKSPNFEDVETFDNPGGEAPGTSAESFTIEILQSHGAAGAYNLLKPLEETLVTFAYQIDADAVNSVDNPELSGNVYVPPIPIIDAGVKKFSPITLEFKVDGIPVLTTDGTPVYATHA